MPPKFSLQTVLDVRHKRAESVEIEFSKLLMREKKITSEIEALEKNKLLLQKRLQDQMVGEMDLFNIAHLRANINQHDTTIGKCHLALANLQVEIGKKRQQLISARQDEETLDILKEKENKRFKENEAIKENKEQDDIYISRDYHKRMEIDVDNK
jgi:flagellar protein FliJ